MNLDALLDSLKKHEGLRLTPYKDSMGILTCGYGRNLERPITAERAEQWLREDVEEAIAEMKRAFPSYTLHNDARQNVLLEMLFNMGAPRLAGFKKMWAALAKTDYETAAQEMLLSGWAVQVGKRAVTLSERMRNG